MPVLRTTHVVAVILVLAPIAAHAAPAAPAPKKPPTEPSSSQGVQHEGAKREPAKHERAQPSRRAVPGALKSASRGSTAHLAPAAGPQRAALSMSMSIGSPTDGRLIGGAYLADAPYLRVYPIYGHSDVRWGVEALVGLVDRAAKSVRNKFPDAVLSVGHLSKAGGGELGRHASHESGRDADIGFFVKNAAGKPVLPDHMVAFIGDGTAPSAPGVHFDDARNWSLISAMVGDGHAHITHIFVATPIRQRLLAYAEKIGAPPVLRNRAAEVLAQPHGALPHDDHFHVRIACPSGMDKCVEVPVAHHGQGRRFAVASNGHAGHPSHRAYAAAGGASHAPAVRPVPAPAPHSAPAGPAAPPSRAPHRSESSTARSEAPIPSLTPSVAGLDSAVIPSPLTGVRSTWGTAKDPAPAAPGPAADPISDPDGVLDAD